MTAPHTPAERAAWAATNGHRHPYEPAVDDFPPIPPDPDDDPYAGTRLGTPYTRSQLATLPKIGRLVDGVVSTPATVVLVGSYGLGKSVLAHALGCSVATGRPWLSRDVQQHKVLFAVGEGAYGLDARITAWEKSYNRGEKVPDDRVTFLNKPASLRNELTWTEIAKYAIDGEYRFVILDTFSSLAPDADETKDAARIMRAMSDLSAEIGGTVMLVHHPGWSDAGRTRGGYQFEANADEVLVLTSVAEGSSLVCLTRKKVKDGVSGGTLWLNRKPCFGAVVLESARPDDSDVPLRNRILAVLGNYGDMGATGPQLKTELAVPDTGVSGFYKSLRRLVDEDIVRAEGHRRAQRYFAGDTGPVQTAIDTPQETR